MVDRFYLMIGWVFVILLSLNGCYSPCYYYTYDWGFNYLIDEEKTITTKYGIKVDDGGQNVGQEVYDMIDTMTREVEECLSEKFPDNDLTYMPGKAFCYEDTFRRCVDKECLRVKIPNDWYWNSKGNQQLLQDDAPSKGCEDKGMPPGDCKWRGGLQDGYIVITTPNLQIFKDPLIKYMTRCDSVWNNELKECAGPGRDAFWNVEP